MNYYQNLPRAPLWRRLLAMLYDTLVVCALLMVVTMMYYSVINVWLLHQKNAAQGYNPVLGSLLFIVIFMFFSIFWRRSGQTLGMRAWRVRVQRYDGRVLSWSQCLLRFIIAIPSLGCIGLGYLWTLFTPQKQTWHDLYSESEIVVLPKREIRKRP